LRFLHLLDLFRSQARAFRLFFRLFFHVKVQLFFVE